MGVEYTMGLGVDFLFTVRKAGYLWLLVRGKKKPRFYCKTGLKKIKNDASSY
jgi:hypothetical protein